MNGARLRQARAVRRLIRAIGVRRVVTAAGLLQLPLLTVLGTVLRWLPRERSLIVFGAPLDRFADNSAYLFAHLSTSRPDLSAVWITGSREVCAHLRASGLPAELRWSGPGIRTCLRSGTFVYSGYRSDINHFLVAGAVTVSLWHGIGIKRVGEGTATPGGGGGGRLARWTAAVREAPADYFLSSTEFVTRTIFSPAFGTPPERCWELGYPRNDHLVQGRPPPDCLVSAPQQWQELAASPRVVGVFLTWRDDRADDAIDEALLLRLAAVCRHNGARLVYKAHYNVHPTSVLADNCTLLSTDADLNAHLGLCDVLVTDYSSVAADFLLMRRPALYYMPDLEQYAERPGFYFPPERLPGTLVRSADQLVEQLEALLQRTGPPAWSDEDEDFLRMVWGDRRGSSCEDVMQALVDAAPVPRPHERSSGRRRARRAEP